MSSHMNSCNQNYSVALLTYGDMKLFESNDVWLNDRIVMCFLRLMSFISSKIALIDLMTFTDNHCTDFYRYSFGSISILKN